MSGPDAFRSASALQPACPWTPSRGSPTTPSRSEDLVISAGAVRCGLCAGCEGILIGHDVIEAPPLRRTRSGEARSLHPGVDRRGLQSVARLEVPGGEEDVVRVSRFRKH